MIGQIASLKSSDHVNGTKVYGADGARIGTIDHLMTHKVSWQGAYAVNPGEEHRPNPWSKSRRLSRCTTTPQ